MFAYQASIQIDRLFVEVIHSEQALALIETIECQHAQRGQWSPLAEAYAEPELGHLQRIWVPNQPWSV